MYASGKKTRVTECEKMKPIFFVERNGELIKHRYDSLRAVNTAAAFWRKKYPKDKIEVKGYVEI